MLVAVSIFICAFSRKSSGFVEGTNSSGHFSAQVLSSSLQGQLVLSGEVQFPFGEGDSVSAGSQLKQSESRGPSQVRHELWQAEQD